MNRKLKSLGLAFVAVLAIAAVSARAASAETTSEVAHTIISGEQNGIDIATFHAGSLACKMISYSGTRTVTVSPSLQLLPAYKECTAFGFPNTNVDVNGCVYEFTSTSPGVLHILCPAGKVIEVTAFNCTVTVPSQTVATGITYVNEGAGNTRDVTIKMNLTGITYHQHPNFPGGCKSEGTTGAGATSLFHDGKYVGQATVTAADTAGAHVGFIVD